MLKKLRALLSSPEKYDTSRKPPNAEVAKEANSDLLLWWFSDFTEAEREHILRKYQPLVFGVRGDSQGSLDRVIGPDGSLRIRLTALATWFLSPPDEVPLALRLLRKGIDLGEENQGTILDKHYTLFNIIKVYYRNRTNDEVSLGLALAACERQIAIAPLVAKAYKRERQVETLPEHPGFKQLSIVREQQADYNEAIRLSKVALEQGWSGDWEKRIARCVAKRQKQYGNSEAELNNPRGETL